MKKSLLFLLFFSIFSSSILCQPEKKVLSSGLYILPSQLVFTEIIITYERFVAEKRSYSYSLGAKIPTRAGSTLLLSGHGPFFGDYFFQQMINKHLSAVYTSFAPSFYLDDIRDFFIQPEMFYRLYWLSSKKLVYDDFNDQMDFNSVRSERVHVLGIKGLFGINNRIDLTKHKTLNVKLLMGIGVRYKDFKFTNIDNKIERFQEETIVVPHEIIRKRVFVPSFHVGIKIGMARLF